MYCLIVSNREILHLKNGYFALIGKLIYLENRSFSIFIAITAIAGVILLNSIKEKE